MVIMFRLAVPEKHFGMRRSVVFSQEMVTAVTGERKEKTNTHIQMKVAVGSQCHSRAWVCSQNCNTYFKTHKTVPVDPAKTLTLGNKRGHASKNLF